MRNLFLLACSLGLLSAGCNSQPYRTAERLERGLVIVLPGVEGRGAFNEAICRGLDAGGVNWAIELYDWTSPLGPLYNLRAEEANRRKAGDIARKIIEYRWNYPGRPVVVVGQSGGGAMAVWTAEALAPGGSVDGLILLAAALSPTYTLDFALANTSRGLINFYSPRDWVFLGVGTVVSGTMDGEHSSSAGQVGFDILFGDRRDPDDLKVFQVAWEPKMAQAGHTGSHLTSGAEKFVATYVAPLVLIQKWDSQTVQLVIDREWLEGTAGSWAETGGPAPARSP